MLIQSGITYIFPWKMCFSFSSFLHVCVIDRFAWHWSYCKHWVCLGWLVNMTLYPLVWIMLSLWFHSVIHYGRSQWNRAFNVFRSYKQIEQTSSSTIWTSKWRKSSNLDNCFLHGNVNNQGKLELTVVQSSAGQCHC